MARQREWSCGSRLFQNLRANHETELVNDFPIHVVTEWLGNTPAVATKHYLQVTDDHFAQAVGAPLGTVSGEKEVPADDSRTHLCTQQHEKSPGTLVSPGISDTWGSLNSCPART